MIFRIQNEEYSMQKYNSDLMYGKIIILSTNFKIKKIQSNL